MKTRRLLNALMWLLSISAVASAQESAQSDGAQPFAQPVEHPAVYSPQVEAMMRYDDPSVSLNTGTVTLTVPLVEFEDPDFDVDVSITYCSDGFKPLQPDNYVGMGWRLNCGGVITREIHGIPDEFYGIHTDGGFVGGYEIPDLKGFRMGAAVNSEFKSKLISSESLDGEFQHAYIEDGTRKIVVRKGGKTEMSPDLYRFNFGSHSGQFMQDIDGHIKVISDDGGDYIVEFNGDAIRITTDDGYKYIFGGEYSALEYTALAWRDFSDAHDSPEKYIESNRKHKREITAYHLTKVTAPNGRELTYTYLNMPSSVLYEDPVEMFDNSFYNTTYNLDSYMKCFQVMPSIKGEHSQGSINYCSIYYSLNKVALLSSISTYDQGISFTYDNHASPYFCLSRHSIWPQYKFISGCGAKLTSVKATHGISGFTETANLNYRTDRGRLLLTSVHNSKTGVFRYEYCSSGSFDRSLTIDIDKWGYWSGAGANTSIKQLADTDRLNQIDELTGCFYRVPNDTNREPTGKEYDVYMLKTVTYPTGGSIKYEYEPHTYSSYYHQPSIQYYPMIGGVNSMKKLAGGARIRRIISDDGFSSLKQMKCFQYDGNDGRSSGVLCLEGENYLKFYPVSRLEGDEDNPLRTCLFSDSYKILKQASLGGYISYGLVKEYEYEAAADDMLDEEMPHKVTEFITPSVGYDPVKTFVSDTICRDFSGHIPDMDEIKFLEEYYAYRRDFSRIYGKKRSESYYNYGHQLQKKTEYTYRTMDMDYTYFIHGYPSVSGSVVGCYSQVACVPFYHHFLTEVKTMEYDPEGREKVISVSNEYDERGYKVLSVKTDSEGRKIKTKYGYPWNHKSLVFGKMLQMNITSPIVSQTVTLDDSEVIYKRFNEYKFIDREAPSVPVDTLQYPEKDIVLPVIDAVHDTYGSGKLEEQVEYLSHDQFGNPLWIRSHGRDYVYVWSCGGKEILAIVQGSTEPEVAGVLGVDGLNAISVQYEPSDEIGAIIRAALPHAMVTSYTYLQGCGVSSETFPDGQTIHYEYDDKGRLSYLYRIDDGVKSIVEKYDYNLVNE